MTIEWQSKTDTTYNVVKGAGAGQIYCSNKTEPKQETDCIKHLNEEITGISRETKNLQQHNSTHVIPNQWGYRGERTGDRPR